jgi:hypothetical protein
MTHRYVYLKDFTKHPGPRYRRLGPDSAEEFRESYLVPAIESSEQVIVNFDGVLGIASSFMEGAFGELVRTHKYSADFLYSKLTFEGNRLEVIEAWECIKEAAKNG